ncbi:unnamed protein product [Ceutorhynchus assimilis]|uniref:General transcription factor 3C polypeptide 3 n=1 Tax=Ceutorhynchus assimilis TaxID=467358 RepID=A0A9N9QIR3_9CUCU|nr:unnamed protein product [Ceutorhynchus assimilis]
MEMDEDLLLKSVPEHVQDPDDPSDEETEPVPRKAKPSKLPPSLRGLMGEANIRFARGEIELSKKMCFEVIRQAPEAYEPYLTLAQMYENQNMKKYKGFLMLAGHLHPSDTEIWCRLADVELQDNQVSAAISCYNRAIKARPNEVELHVKRLRLIEERVPSRNSLGLKLGLAKALPKNKPAQILQICSEVAKEYFEAKNYMKAIEALKICLRRIPNNITPDVLNMMLELLLLSERFSECLDIFTQFCGFQFDVTVGEDMSITINSYLIPENLHVDLKSKFIVCIIGLQSYQLIEELIKEMITNDDIEVNGMLYFDIAEALMASFLYAEALQLLIPLVKSKNFSLAGIWLKHAECLTQLRMYEQAIEAYMNVISMAPNHVDVLYPLAMLLLQQDRKEEALAVLSQDMSSGKLHVAVLIEQMKLLKQIGDLANYWKCCELLLSRHCIQLKNYTELRILLHLKGPKGKQNKIAKMRIVNGEEDTEMNLISVFEPAVEDEYKLYLEILQFAFEKKAYLQFQKFAFMGLGSKKFVKYFSEIFLIACHSCIFCKDYYHGYLIAKELLFHQPQNNQAWNLYSIMLHNHETTKMSRFFDAPTVKSRMPIGNTELVKANNFCSVGQYSQSLTYFLKEYKTSKNSYSAFMIGLIMLQQYCQKKENSISKKSMVEMVTYLFLNYAKIRTKNAQQEAFYNMGRMYQQIGIFSLAEHYYKMVFEVQNDYLDKYPDYLDLKKQAAFNLHLIYKSSGNFQAARKILFRYIVIE